MRVCLHTIRELGPDYVGGTERLLLELAKELTSVGHQVRIVATGAKGDIEIEGVLVSQRIPDAYRAGYVKHGFANSAFIRKGIIGDLSREEGMRAIGRFVDEQLVDQPADLLHLNSFAAAMFSEVTDGAVITSHENDREQERSWGADFTDWMGGFVRAGLTQLGRASLLTAPSAHYAAYYAQLLALPVRHVKAGVSLSTFDRARRRRNGRSRGEVLEVLLPARFEPTQKGHAVALEACAILCAQGERVRFTFSGVRKDYKERMASFYEEAQSRGIASSVRAVSYADIRRGYDNCDVVISPERFCSYGLSVSEALSLGIPTVLSDIPTYREIATGFGHAYFFSDGNPAELASSIKRAARTSEDTRDREAVRFRIAHDLRAVAVELTDVYSAIQSSTSV